MRFLLVAILSLGAALSWAAPNKPNILVLYADDLGLGDLGCFNPDSKIPTPNLDALAAGGMRFRDAHSSSGICTPSRYALLTGRHHWRDFHGIVNAFGGSVFKKGQVTMASMLKEQGYRTAAIGKWHLGWDWAAIRKEDAKRQGEGRKAGYGPEAFHWDRSIPDGPLDHGFDHYFGDTVINFPPYCWIEDEKVVTAPDVMMDSSKWPAIKEGNWECRPGPMASDWNPYENIPTTTRKGVEWIKAQADTEEPFFLYFAWPSPHAPIIPNDQFDGKSGAGPYGDFVFETDDSAGQILRALEESGQAENTIVVFSADNGPEKYAYARDATYDHWSAHPLRGLKRDIYEGGHRVPFILRWPGLVEAGTESEVLISQVDLMQTFADLLGVELPETAALDSHSLLPYLKGEATEVRSSHVHNTKTDQYAIREGDWVLIDSKSGYLSGRNDAWEAKRSYPKDDKAPNELYHLKDDLGQKNDVASEHPERVERLQKLLQEIRDRGHSAPRLVQ